MVPPLVVPAAGLLPPGWPPLCGPAVPLPVGEAAQKRSSCSITSIEQNYFFVRSRAWSRWALRWRGAVAGASPDRAAPGVSAAVARRLRAACAALARRCSRRQSRRAPALVLCCPPARSSVQLSPLCGPPLKRRGGPCSVRAGRGPRWCGCLSALMVPSRRMAAYLLAYRATLGRRPAKVIPPAGGGITFAGLLFLGKKRRFRPVFDRTYVLKPNGKMQAR